MSIDPRVALQSLVAAFEEHLAAAAARRGEKDPSVEGAYLAIADAFEVYEEVLYDAYGEVTPLEIYDDEDGDEDLLDDDEEMLRSSSFGGPSDVDTDEAEGFSARTLDGSDGYGRQSGSDR